jgi:ketosteroid isomerase-like protein
MRLFALSVLMLLAVAPAAHAQTTDPEVMAPITKFMETFNKGDVAGAASTHAADAVIVDEVPPFEWRGQGAFQAWAGDLAAYDKKNGISDEHVAISAATRTEVDGDRAYVIAPAVYTFKQGGASMRASSQMTFALKKESTGWMIQAWTWTGPKAKKAAAGK